MVDKQFLMSEYQYIEEDFSINLDYVELDDGAVKLFDKSLVTPHNQGSKGATKSYLPTPNLGNSTMQSNSVLL